MFRTHVSIEIKCVCLDETGSEHYHFFLIQLNKTFFSCGDRRSTSEMFGRQSKYIVNQSVITYQLDRERLNTCKVK